MRNPLWHFPNNDIVALPALCQSSMPYAKSASMTFSTYAKTTSIIPKTTYGSMIPQWQRQ
jgi:hypothetical protein